LDPAAPDLQAVPADQRPKALRWLARNGGEAAIEQIREGLNDPSPAVRAAAANAIADVKDRQSARRLRQLAASDPSQFVRLAAVEALGEVGAVEELAQVVTDPKVDPEVKQPALDDLPDAAADDPPLEGMALNALMDALRSADSPDLATDILAAISDLGDPSAVQPLINYFQSLDPPASSDWWDVGEEALYTIEDVDINQDMSEPLEAWDEKDPLNDYAAARVPIRQQNPSNGALFDKTYFPGRTGQAHP